MYTIFEQGQGRGTGYLLRSFLKRFIDICEDHLESGKAAGFAFIFYDFEDKGVRSILREQGVFTELDRLSGHDLSIFYLHSKEKEILKKFNQIFMDAFELDQSTSLPFVLFFGVKDREVNDLKLIELEQTRLLFAFHELHKILENEVKRIQNKKTQRIPSPINKISNLANIVKKVALEKIIDKGLEDIFF